MTAWILGYMAAGFVFAGFIHDKPKGDDLFSIIICMVLWPFLLCLELGAWLRRICQ